VKKESRINEYKPRNQFVYLAILPAALIMSIVLVVPILFNIIGSFTNMDLNVPLNKSNFVGAYNYISILKDTNFWTIVLRNLWWTIAVLSFAFIIGLVLAIFLKDQKFGKFFLNIWIVPWAMPEITTAIVWVILLSPDFGPFNFLLKNLHIISTPIPWLSSGRLALWGVIITAVWKFFPFNMAMIYSGLQTFPEELHDAAKVDGVNAWQFFWHLQLPWIRPVVSIVSLLGFIWVFNWFSLIYAMTRGGPGGSTDILAIYIYKRAIEYFHTSEAATLSVLVLLFMIPFIILFVLYNISKKEN
jgi:multiple sugar transport system permease protein